MLITLSDVVAVLALLLSAYAIWTTARFNKRQLALVDSQERLNAQLLAQGEVDARDARRADLGANFVRLGRSRYRLKVFNRGRAPAHNVEIEFPDDDPPVIASDVRDKFPLEVLEPQQGVDLIAAIHMGTKSKHTVKLRWRDAARDANEKTVYPTL